MENSPYLQAFLNEVYEHLSGKTSDVISYSDLFIYASRSIGISRTPADQNEGVSEADVLIVNLVMEGLFALEEQGWSVVKKEFMGNRNYIFSKRKKDAAGN